MAASVVNTLSKLILLASLSACTTIEYGQGKLDLKSKPKSGTTDPMNHSIDILDHSAKNLEMTEIRLLDKTGAGCAAGATLGAATSAQNKAIKDSPNAPVVAYQYRVYGSDEVGGSHCGVIYREGKGNKISVTGDATARGTSRANVSLREYGFNLRNGYAYEEISWGVELALLFGEYKIPTYPIGYFDPVSKTFFERTSKVSKTYAVVPLEVFATYSPKSLFGLGAFSQVGLNLATYTDLKYSLGVMYSFGLGESWLLQAKLRQSYYTAKIIGQSTQINETMALVGISYLFGHE